MSQNEKDIVQDAENKISRVDFIATYPRKERKNNESQKRHLCASIPSDGEKGGCDKTSKNALVSKLDFNNFKNSNCDLLQAELMSEQVLNDFDQSLKNEQAAGVSERSKALEGLRNRLEKQGGRFRLLAGVDQNFQAKLNDLENTYANFAPVIQHLREEFAKNVRFGDGIFGFSPILLLGPPGVGKSAFATTLSKLFSIAPYMDLNFAVADAIFNLTGMARGYSESKLGRIAGFLVDNVVMNGIIYIDEIDKPANTGSKHGNVTNVLYSLLEPSSSEFFTDEWLETSINASFLNYIMTANDVEKIPAPILDRCTIFEIKNPTHEQMKKVVPSIYNKICAKYPNLPEPLKLLDPSVVEVLSDANPRSIRKNLEAALGKVALRDKDMCITTSDLEGLDIKRGTQSITVGFIPSGPKTIH